MVEIKWEEINQLFEPIGSYSMSQTMEGNKTITISKEEFINTVAKFSADVFAKNELALSMAINYIGAYLTTVLFDTKEEK